MGRTIFTERDIEDFAKRGIKEIEVNESVYITDVAREKMEALGIKTKSVTAAFASPGPGPTSFGVPSAAPTASTRPLGEAERQEVIEKVKSGVIARLGPGVDAALLDNLVKRVVGQL